MQSRRTQCSLLGRSVEKRAIGAFVFGDTRRPTTLLLGAVHGDEPKTVYVARMLMDLLDESPRTADGRGWVVVPIVNPDGYERRKRRNANKVDINRNFPTRNWEMSSKRSRMFGGMKAASEPETRAIIRAVERFKPSRIITIHSIGLNRFCNNYDGPGRALARAMGRFNGYPVTANIGYPTPGSFGTWAGVERNIPTVTLELPSHHSSRRCWEDNRRALLANA